MIRHSRKYDQEVVRQMREGKVNAQDVFYNGAKGKVIKIDWVIRDGTVYLKDE